MTNLKYNICVFYSFFKVLIYFIFVFSGSFKWIPLPLDLTIFSGIICVTIVLFEIKNINRFNSFWDKCIVFLLFFLNIYFLFSNVFSISETYASSKNLSIILNLFTILYPIVVFDKSIFNMIKLIYLGLGIFLIFLLFMLYFNDMFIIFHDSEALIYNVPTYLIVSITLSTCFILSFGFKTNLFLIIYRILILFLMFELGGRGPVLNLMIAMLLYYFLRFDFSFASLKVVNLKNKAIIYISLFILFFIFFSPQIFTFLNQEIDFQRFFNFDDYMGDESVLIRANYLKKGFNSILDHPFLGLGIGSSGLILEGNDGFTYPHNLFIEAFMEIGFFGAFAYLFMYLFFFFANISFVKKNRELLLLYLVALLFFLEDNKSNSFDSWRISVVWIMFFLIDKKKYLQNSINSNFLRNRL